MPPPCAEPLWAEPLCPEPLCVPVDGAPGKPRWAEPEEDPLWPGPPWVPVGGAPGKPRWAEPEEELPCAEGGPPWKRPPPAPPPGPPRPVDADAGPPEGNVPLVAWPSVSNAQVAGAQISSARAPTNTAFRSRAVPGAANASAATRPPTISTGGSHLSCPGELCSTMSSVTNPAATASGPTMRAA